MYFLPWNRHKDLKFHTLATSFSIPFTHVQLSTAQHCFLWSNNENAGFVPGPSYQPVGPVLGHNRSGVIPQNKSFITIFVVKSLMPLVFQTQIILSLCYNV